MKLIVSPAKSLDFETPLPTQKSSNCFFKNEANELNALLKKQTPKELRSLLKISEKLAELNWKRNLEFSCTNDFTNSRQAIYAFNGDVYQGLDAYSLSESKIEVLQERLMILSGLYGLLKPLDMIAPYRLEMGTNLQNSKGKNLYEFWSDKITAKLNSLLKEEEILLNLASNEYFKTINTKKLKATIITPVFKDYKNGKLRVISFFAKKARGLFVRFVIDHNINTINDLKQFDAEGYQLDASLSSEDKFVFIR
jgi:cytoplasmic iron level regulating protein YaaA (DUF328/UPF0246 family)